MKSNKYHVKKKKSSFIKYGYLWFRISFFHPQITICLIFRSHYNAFTSNCMLGMELLYIICMYVCYANPNFCLYLQHHFHIISTVIYIVSKILLIFILTSFTDVSMIFFFQVPPPENIIKKSEWKNVIE